MDFHIQPFQITSAVIGIIATRLLRKLCTQCREAYVPTDREIGLMELTRNVLADKKIYKNGGGCDKCQGVGYTGRMGVYELLVFNDEIREVIARTQDGKVIKKVAVSQGMVTLRQAAIRKVVAGLTSLDEAIQNTQADEFEPEK
jgi:general secretion pathway protein E